MREHVELHGFVNVHLSMKWTAEYYIAIRIDDLESLFYGVTG